MPLRPVVDSIADHSMAPAYLLKELGIPELERLRFRLADGSVAEYGIGTANFEIEGRTRPCPVVFGPGYTSLLGDSTLQIFNLEYDPESNRLAPASNLIIGRVGVNCVLPKEPERLRPTAVAPRDGYRIWLRYSDGTAGEVDLSISSAKAGSKRGAIAGFSNRSDSEKAAPSPGAKTSNFVLTRCTYSLPAGRQKQ